MSVDILRAIEVKDKNGKWHQVKCSTMKKPKLSWWQKTWNGIANAYNRSHFRELVKGKWLQTYWVRDGGPWDNIYVGNKDFWSKWLEDNGHRGLPKDADKEAVDMYNEYGCDFCWASYDEIKQAMNSYKKQFLSTIKGMSTYSKLNEILDILNKVKKPSKAKAADDELFEEFEPYYPNYEWDDLEINDAFDDKFACMLWMYEMFTAELTMADFAVNTIDDYVPTSDIRIIYIYNN